MAGDRRTQDGWGGRARRWLAGALALVLLFASLAVLHPVDALASAPAGDAIVAHDHHGDCDDDSGDGSASEHRCAAGACATAAPAPSIVVPAPQDAGRAAWTGVASAAADADPPERLRPPRA